MKKTTLQILNLLLFWLTILFAQPANTTNLKIVSEFQPNLFPLVQNHTAAAILSDAEDAEVVGITANAIANDIEQISGTKPAVISALKKNQPYLVIAGTIGHSAYIDQLIKSKKLDVSGVSGKWESFTITTIDAPMTGVKQALVIAGSDRRGTAYGLFEISRMSGVSPWIWWADVTPAPRKALFVTPGTAVSGEPSVKYRGIFINDEDWGLNPWAARTQDKDIKDIGPKTYARVFELMLRLRANTIWPAMHDSTKAFFHYPENPIVADKYAIVMGSTHCDQMLRSNTFEWQKGYEKEYGAKPGEYRYDTNKSEVYRYWDDRVKAVRNYESMFTIGMRGVRDGGIVGPPSKEGKIALLDTIIRDQREMFNKYFGDTTKVPQLFIPYKEVLDLYRRGLKVPDDVTLVWTDDNYGYIRQLSTPAEQKRSGASGIYYHLEYLGKPHDYTWLSTNSPSLISYEMTKAYQFGANRFWMVNVGDIKPAEMEIEFFIDLAWNPSRWTPEKASQYAAYWAEQTFGKEFATEIAAVKSEYYRLAQSGKPEHLGILRFDSKTRQQRLVDYTNLVRLADKVKARLPQRLHNAFFELIEYPVKGAALMNQKIFYAQMSQEVLSTDQNLARDYSVKVRDAFNQIKTLTQYYNAGIEKGKWNGMMSYAPRNLSVYDMPQVAVPEVLSDAEKPTGKYIKAYIISDTVKADFTRGIYSFDADSFTSKQEAESDKIASIDGLGLGGKSVSRYPFTGVSFKKEEWSKAPFVEYAVSLKSGRYEISLKCLPTQAIHSGRSLAMAVSINNQEPQFVDVNQAHDDKKWMLNLLRGYSETTLPINIGKDGKSTVRIYLLDTGLALSRVDIF
jgi:hypothetical protein